MLLTALTPLLLMVTIAQAPVAPPTHDGPAPAPGQRGDASASSYVVGAQDQLSITVSNEESLTGKFRVDNDGSFHYPYLGRVMAAGRTLTQLQSELTSLLAAGYLRNPQVRVEIDQYRSRRVFVTGEVRAPNEYMMSGSMTLLQALALAGSPTATASNEIIVSRQPATPGGQHEIIRVNRKDLELGKAAFDLMLRDGDIINVPVAQRFYISGSVKNPGYYVLDPGMTMQQAIALAGGLTDRGSDRRLTVSRMVGTKLTQVTVRLESQVQANDTINVPQRFF